MRAARTGAITSHVIDTATLGTRSWVATDRAALRPAAATPVALRQGDDR